MSVALVFRATDAAANAVNSNSMNWAITAAVVVTWDPALALGGYTLSNGDRTTTWANNSNRNARSTISRTGKIYYEGKINTAGNAGTQNPMFGFCNATHNNNNKAGGDLNSITADNLCQISFNGGALGSYSAFVVNDVFMLAYDTANGHFWVGKNGTWLNSGNPAAGTGFVGTGFTGAAAFACSCVDTIPGAPFCVSTANFKDTEFQFTPPTGFTALG